MQDGVLRANEIPIWPGCVREKTRHAARPGLMHFCSMMFLIPEMFPEVKQNLH
jgi:hypothetical protein